MQKEKKGNETAANIQMSFKPEWTISSLKQTTAFILPWVFFPTKDYGLVKIFLTDLQPLEHGKLCRA